MTSRVRAPIPILLLAVPLLVLLDTGFVRADCQADCVLVNTASDTINPTCNTSGIGTCSLRDALIIVQGFEGWSIRFAIGTGHQTINLMSNLPDIIKSGTIDGRTQPGFAGVPLIEIHRADAGSAWRGLHLGQPPFLTSAGVAMKALVINHFNGICADCGGIIMDNPGGNYIQGCYIGTDAAGMAADGNTVAVLDNTLGGNTYGGPLPIDHNVISGNPSGINITTVQGGYSAKDIIQGNYFGLNALGTAELHNGLSINVGKPYPGFSPGILIGGPLGSGAGNVFAGIGNTGQAIQLDTAGDILAGNNVIQGNLIGLDKTGLVSLPLEIGIALLGNINATVVDNVISVTEDGIQFLVSGTGTTGTIVRNNYIGTDITGNKVLVAGVNGINISGGHDNTIGGSVAGQGNVIGGFQFGIFFGGGSSTGNVIQGNRIGIGVNGTPIPNSLAGIYVNGSGSEIIGGENPGEGNVIAFNGFPTTAAVPGISVGNVTRNTISGNSIYGNSGLGIDLSLGTVANGVTANDACDADTGPNNYQNYPVITSVTSGPTTRIQGTLNSVATLLYRLEFFANPNCDASGNGEGQTYLGFFDVTTDGSCNATFDVTFSVPTSSTQAITATATDPSGNTSEFSSCAMPHASFYTVPPCRVVDTRGPVGPYGGPSLAAGADRTFVFGGQCVIPSTATAVALNVVAILPTAGPGFLTLFPGGSTRPLASTINYKAGQIRANDAIIPLGSLQDIVVHCQQGLGTVDMVIDVTGYFQ